MTHTAAGPLAVRARCEKEHMTSYQTARYNVIRNPVEPTWLYVVTDMAGKIVSPNPSTLRAACQRADLYQAEDDQEAREREECALEPYEP